MPRKSTYDRTVLKSASRKDDEARRLSELSALVHLGLGHPLDARTFQRIAVLQSALQARQTALASALQATRLSPENYLDQLQSALAEWARQTESALGRERFVAIFGPTDATGIIDPQLFKQQVEEIPVAM